MILHYTNPVYRHGLKGLIHASGYRSQKQFSEDIKYDTGDLSRVINGWMIPSQNVQKVMIKKLRITSEHLVKLLQ